MVEKAVMDAERGLITFKLDRDCDGGKYLEEDKVIPHGEFRLASDGFYRAKSDEILDDSKLEELAHERGADLVTVEGRSCLFYNFGGNKLLEGEKEDTEYKEESLNGFIPMKIRPGVNDIRNVKGSLVDVSVEDVVAVGVDFGGKMNQLRAKKLATEEKINYFCFDRTGEYSGFTSFRNRMDGKWVFFRKRE